MTLLSGTYATSSPFMNGINGGRRWPLTCSGRVSTPMPQSTAAVARPGCAGKVASAAALMTSGGYSSSGGIGSSRTSRPRRTGAALIASAKGQAVSGGKSQFKLFQKKVSPSKPMRDDSAFVLPYMGLSAAIAIQWLAQVAFQQQIMDSLVEADPLLSLVQSLGFAPLGIAAAFSLMQAAQGNRLYSQTYIRLNVALLVWQVAPMLNLVLESHAITNPALYAARLAVAIPTVMICGAALKSSAGSQNLITASIDDFKSVVNVPSKKTLLGKYLSANTIISILVGASFTFSPTPPVDLAGVDVASGFEAAATHAFRTDFGIQLALLLPCIYNVLLDGAERGRLGSKTFRNLNFGAAAATFIITGSTLLGVFFSATAKDSDLVVNVLSASAIGTSTSIVYLYQALFAKKEA